MVSPVPGNDLLGILEHIVPGELILYKWPYCIHDANVAIIDFTIWVDGHLNSFEKVFYYKD